MMIYPFPLMDVISQIKAYIFSVSMENRAVKLCYLSETQNNANQKHPQNNQLEALHFLLWQNKLPKMENTCNLTPVYLMLTSDGLFMPLHVWLCLWSCCWLAMHASQKKKQVKMTSRDLNCSTYLTMPVHNFIFNEDTTAYRKDEHQSRSIRFRKIKLCFMPRRHIFIILLTSAQKSYAPLCLIYISPPFFLILCTFSFPYCLWLYCRCLGPTRTNDESKGNTTTNSKGKKVCTIPNKRVGKCSSEMLSICIYPCRVVIKTIKTLNICICLTSQIILFLALKELFINHLDLIWVETYFLFPFTGNLWYQAVSLHFYIMKIVYYNDWLYECYTAFSLIKKIYINQILESISLIMSPFVETETVKTRFHCKFHSRSMFLPNSPKTKLSFCNFKKLHVIIFNVWNNKHEVTQLFIYNEFIMNNQ